MRFKKMALLVMAIVFALMLAAIIFFAVRMNIEHKAYTDTLALLEESQKDYRGLSDELKDAKKKIAALEGTEYVEEEEESPADGANSNYSIADIVAFNLSDQQTIKLLADPDSKKDHYVQVGVVLSLNSTDEDYETYSATLATNEGLIKDMVNKVIGGYTYSEISAMEVKDVQDAILKELKKMYDSEFIVGVSFSSWYIQ
ncbi:MAG: flagellar basal body-associated FliL family protein [Lachnospiraceae bacterium]|nr:flagellar basal body-associated FliL family protein [Lachnospiraceae bacterium]